MTKQSFFGGLAIFSMFFGSGNLIFPLLIGRDAGSHWFVSIFGLGISGILLPLLGLITMLFLKDNMEVFYRGLLNNFGALIAALLLLALCGPIGIIPRCITVAEGAWQTFFPSQNGNVLFVFVCCSIIWASLYFHSNLMDLIGKYFTPFKLIGLLTIIFSSIFVALKTNPPSLLTSVHHDASSSFLSGLVTGYGTMDLLGALFFGPTIVAYFAKKDISKNQMEKECAVAMIFGFSIIFFVYACLIYLGSFYSFLIKDTEPTLILPQIVNLALGEYSYYLVSLTLIIATLVTAVALTSVTVDYVAERVKFLNNKRKSILNISILLIFIFASLGFNSIMNVLMPILQVFYPITIFILMVNIYKLFKKHRQY